MFGKLRAMNDPWILWSCAGLIVFIASLIQSMIGFGFALIALPLWLGLGFELPNAVALTVTTSIFQRVTFAWSMREHIPWKKLRAPIISSVCFLFVGIFALGIIAGQNRDLIRQCVGGLLVAMVIVQNLIRIKPREHLHTGWGILAGSASGFLGGLMNIGGPPMVLWSYAHNWTQQTLRVALIASTLPGFPLQVALLFWRFGTSIGTPLLIGIAFAPLALIGMKIGRALGHRFHVQILRTVVMASLIAMGFHYLLKPFLK